eukprot:424849_1
MAFGLDDVARVDKYLLIAMMILYVVCILVPMGISNHQVVHRPTDKHSEKAYDSKWYKWKKQYIWHELWYRTHVIWIVSLIIIFIFEARHWPVYVPFLTVIVFLCVTIALKHTSKKVRCRVPSDDQKQKLYAWITGTMRSSSNADAIAKELNIDDEWEDEAGDITPVPTAADIETKMGQTIELTNDAQTKDTADAHHD